MKTRIFITGLALMAMTVVANGQKAETDNNQANTQTRGAAYVDKNNDGVCDNFNNRNVNRPGQGKFCYRGGKGNGNGKGNCYRGGNGSGQGRGQGRNFVDKNNDGVCDNFENATRKE